MDGNIGVLYQYGKQVGGIYDWEISLNFDTIVKDGWEEVKVIKKISALSYWLVEVPADEAFDIELYKHMDNQLILMDTGRVNFDMPDDETLNRRLYAPLELT